ncbi:hypothetical protein D3C80_1645910 [compost metagenome]
MLLLVGEQDRDDLPIRRDNEGRRHVLTGVCGFPGIEGAALPMVRGLVPSRRKRPMAVGQKGPGRFRPCQHVERQHEDLGVPEHMASVGGAGERPGADRDAVIVWVHGAEQVIDREAQRALRGRVTVDAYVARLPPDPPGLPVGGDQGRQACVDRAAGPAACGDLRLILFP